MDESVFRSNRAFAQVGHSESSAGWDAVLPIGALGEDPYAALDDDELFDCDAGYLAGLASNQANQRRILDPAIVPDADLVVRVGTTEVTFNTLTVSTPTVAAEVFIDKDGHPIPVKNPFYPGLADRAESRPHALSLGLDEQSTCPIAQAFAAAVTLLQIGVESGHDVAELAALFNDAWGVEGVFSPLTASGVAGTREFKRLAATLAMGDARLLVSWQRASAIRSGVLEMRVEDFGEDVHVDFRRVRVVAEALFSVSLEVETWAGLPAPGGTVRYAVPSRSALCAESTTFFPASVGAMPRQKTPSYAEAKVAAAKEVGLIMYLWPNGREELEHVQLAAGPGGIRLAPVEYRSSYVPSGRLQFLAEVGTGPDPVSAAGGLGRTSARAFSAKLSALGHRAPDIAVLTFCSRFAALLNGALCLTAKSQRIKYIAAAVPELVCPTAQALERSFSDLAHTQMNQNLPKQLKGKERSMITMLRWAMWEVVRERQPSNHTIVRGLQRVLGNARAQAVKANVVSRRISAAAPTAAGIATLFYPLKQYWIMAYGGAVVAADVAQRAGIRSDVATMFAIAGAVDKFRRSVMENISLATDGRERAGGVTFEGVHFYVSPYHAAAALRRALAPLLALEIPAFSNTQLISEWLREVMPEVATAVKARVDDFPAGRAHFHAPGGHVTHGAYMLSHKHTLALWLESVLLEITQDIQGILTDRENVASARAEDAERTSQPQYVPLVQRPEYAEAMQSLEDAYAKQAEECAEVGPCFQPAMQMVSEDVWDEFCVVASGLVKAKNNQWPDMMRALRRTDDMEYARRIVDAVIKHFTPRVVADRATIT